MLNTKIEEQKLEGDIIIPKRIMIEVPLTFEMIQDCFSYSASDAPIEIKRLVMEVLGETIDALILAERPSHVSEYWLINKLNQVKVIIEEQNK